MKPWEVFLVSRAVVRVLADSTRTEEIHITEEVTGRPGMRRFMRNHGHTEEYRQLLLNRPELKNEQLDYQFLRSLPATTLGGAYMRHLDSNNLSAESQAVGTTLIEDETMSYLMRRFRQTHDIWHVLMGLGVEGHEEVIIHSFTLGQTHMPVSYLVIFFGTIKHLILEKRWKAIRYALWHAYRSGLRAKPLLLVTWENMWEKDLNDVRREFNISPCNSAYTHA